MLSDEKVKELAEKMPRGFLWSEGCEWESGVLIQEATEFARAIEAAVLAEQAKASTDRDEAYDLIDRQLRNTLDDADYADYSAALDALYLHPAPATEEMVLVPIARLRSLQSSINGNCYMGQEWEIAQINAMIAAAEKEYG